MFSPNFKKAISCLSVFALFLFYFFRLSIKSSNIPLNSDEHEYLRRSYYFELLLKRDFESPWWQKWEVYDQSYLGPYLYRLYFYLMGVKDIKDYLEGVNFNFPCLWEDNNCSFWTADKWWVKHSFQDLDNLPREVLLKAEPIFKAREVALFLAFLSLISFFLISKKLKGYIFAFLSSFLLFQHPLFIFSCLRVMLEPPLLLFMFLSLLLSIYFLESLKKKGAYYSSLILSILMGISAGLATSSKLTGGIILFYYLFLFLFLFGHSRSAGKKKFSLKVLGISFFLIILSFSLIFFLLTPFIWANPLRNTYFMVVHRLAREQQNQFIDFALKGGRARVKAVLDNLLLPQGKFLSFKTIFKLGNFPLDLILFLLGLAILVKNTFRDYLKKKKLGNNFLILLWSINFFSWVIIHIHMAWEHYYLPLIPSIVFCQSLAILSLIGFLLKFLLGKIRRMVLFFNQSMILYLFFLILTFLPLIEGELLGIGRFVLLGSCLPLSIYLYKRKNVNAGLLQLSFILFLFFATLATIFSPVFARSFNNLILYFAYFLYFLVARELSRENKTLFRELLTVALLFPALILSFLSFYFLLASQPPPLMTMNLLFANFGHSHVVDYLIFAFPVSLFLFFKEKNKIRKVLLLLLNLIFVAGFILSFSRGGILMAILSIVLLGVFYLKKEENKTILSHLFLGLIILLLLFSLIFSLVGYYYLGSEKIKSFDSFWLKKAFRQPPFASRIEYWRQSIFAFKERPLLGWGLNNFRYLSKKYQQWPQAWSWYSHNHFLQMFGETGIFGGLSFIVLIYLIFKKVGPFYKGSDLNGFPFRIGLLASTIHSFFDYDWQFPSVFLLFWVIAGYITISKIKNKKLNKFNKIFILFLGTLLFIAAGLEFGSNLVIFAAQKEEGKRDLTKEEKDYQTALKIWPFKLENWQMLVDYYQKNAKREKGLNLLGKLILLEPINDQNYKLIGDWHYQEEDWDRACQYYQKAISLNPTDSEELYFKIIDSWPSRTKKDSQEIFQILTKIEKNKGKDCLLKCLGFENEKKIEALLLQLIKQDEFNQLNQEQQARIYFWLAVLTTYQKDWNQDINFLNQAIALDNQTEYQNFLNDLFLVKKIKQSFEKGDYLAVKETAQVFDKKMEKHIFHEKFYLDEICLWLSKIAEEEGDLELAQKYHQQALTINPWLTID